DVGEGEVEKSLTCRCVVEHIPDKRSPRRLADEVAESHSSCVDSFKDKTVDSGVARYRLSRLQSPSLTEAASKRMTNFVEVKLPCGVNACLVLFGLAGG